MRLYRVIVFGKPQAPWRSTREQARRDAVDLDLGSYDEWGQFFITVPAEIETAEKGEHE